MNRPVLISRGENFPNFNQQGGIKGVTFLIFSKLINN